MDYEIYIPERVFAHGKAESIVFSCTDGEICVQKDHMPMLAALAEGKIAIKQSGETTVLKCGNGCASVKDNVLTIFTEHCEIADGDIKVNYKNTKHYKSKDKRISVSKRKANKYGDIQKP